MSLGFGLYTANFADYNATYGALGAVVALLMWIYLSSWVLLFGAELNSEIEHQTEVDTTRGEAKPMGERRAEVADTVGEIPSSPFSWNSNKSKGTRAPTDRSVATNS